MSKLDRTLDAALREMVAGEGPADLRRRVLARLGEARRRPPVAWTALAAAAGIVVAVASVALLRTAPDRAPAGPSAHPSVPVPSAVRPAEPPPPTVVARTKPARSTVRPAGPTRRDRPQQERWPLDLEAGVDVEPIELAPLAAVAPMGDERMAVNALAIERIEIEPLAEPQP